MGKQRKKPPGKPLPPAPDEEFTAESMRAWGEQNTRQWWQNNAPDEFKNLLEAKQVDEDA